jgi:hypothetical protein
LKKGIFLSFLLIFCMMCLVEIGFANVIVFSNYKTSAEILPDGKLHIIKELTLKNVGRSPIIPGELHFRMYEQDGKEEVPSEITGYSASGHYNDLLSIKKYNYDTQTELVIDIWEPILPGFIYNFKIEYDVDFKPKGILFYNLMLPEEKTTIPIENNIYELVIPQHKHITYTVGGTVSDNKVVWENVDSPQVEYSILPIPKLPIKGVNLFWFSVIMLLCILLALKIFKKDSR